MQTQITPADFATVFARLFTRAAFRVETLDYYDSPDEAEPYRRFLAGEPDDLTWRRPWQTMVREARAAGKTMSRVHVVTEPLSDYLQFEMERAYPANVAAGEDIRIIATRDTDLLDGDYWLIDGWVATMHYNNGTWLGVTLTDDPMTVTDRRAWRDILLRAATPLADYLDHSQPRRKTA